MVEIRNKKLHKKIMKEIEKLDDKALKYYEMGNIKTGEKYEKQADAKYKVNYPRMFKVKKVNGEWVKG